MFIGNVCYVTTPYNENLFRALIELHLKKGPKTFPSKELIEAAIAAYLEIRDSDVPIAESEKEFFEDFLKDNNFEISDYRSFSVQKPVGDPVDSLSAFREIYITYKQKIYIAHKTTE